MMGFGLICCVVDIGNASKVIKISKKYGIKGATVSIGKGFACSSIMNFLALNEERKEIVSMIVENEIAVQAIKGISVEMKFEKPHNGIAFLYSVSDFIGSKNPYVSLKNLEGGKNMFNAIFVVVEKGKAEEVIEAANKVVSICGTIINARGAGIHEIQKFFSIEIEPEKEEVFIITRKKNKDKIVKSIRENLKIDEPGNGILYVLDINEVYGLHGV
ncbi:MAG: P-II family nitrogen regulator [Candidatus Cloacimonetes bacterium]|nr:P-II family nitrogen regulator [Candidatus Cloacimonadota bacterium]